MGNWLHRTMKQLFLSTSPASLPEPRGNYISQPDLSAVAGVPDKYWVISGDTISEMDATGKAAVDAADLSTQRDDAAQEIDDKENTLRQVLKILISEINILRQLHGLPDRTLAQLRNQVRNGYGG